MKMSLNPCIILLFILFVNESFPLPRFSLRENSSCIDCHVNPTGGIIRNRGGWSYSKNMMAMISPRSDFEMSNKISENINFGFDVRGQYLLQMTDSTKKTDFQKMNALLFTTGTKQGLIYNPMYVESGIEVGVNLFEKAFLTASVGNQGAALFSEDPSFTTNLKISPAISDEVGLFFGGSLGIYRDRRSSGAPSFQIIYPQVKMYGGYFGFGYEGFTLMAEYDIA